MSDTKQGEGYIAMPNLSREEIGAQVEASDGDRIMAVMSWLSMVAMGRPEAGAAPEAGAVEWASAMATLGEAWLQSMSLATDADVEIGRPETIN